MPSVIEKWNEKYAGDGLVFGTIPNGFLTQKATFYRPGGHILAAGDGEGRNGVWLAEQGFDVLSVDGARNGITKARQQAEQRGVSSRFHTQCVDLLDWDWPVAAFDGVACLHLYFMPDIRPRLHQAMMDALKPGGIFILEVFHPDHVGRGLGGPSLPELCYSAQDLKNDFAPYRILHLEETERDIASSNFHKGGRGKVSRIVVKKELP